ncbi:uncharacterized protein LOC117786285 [Drosophila innubila]|uniref:uncharacterized protein LOC117786285 n=1 Tax=Drosophila innubila TaxID=198719 RepID=UPI00148E6471|nr:uncharacterized protein LOC117786285 [Drosophila innubila]
MNSLVRAYMLKLLLFVVGCLLPGKLVEAAFLWECEGVIITLISNPNQECSEFVHCDGDNSYYCNGECTEPVICNNTTVIATTQSSVNTEAITNVNTEQPTTEHQHPSTPTTDSATTISSNPHVICKKSSQNIVFPYPANKNYYYQCISKYLLLQQCPQNFYFDESQGKCMGTKPYRL